MKFVFSLLPLLALAREPPVKDQLLNTYHSMKNQTSTAVNETMGTIVEKSKKFGNDISETSKSLFSEIGDFFASIFSSIAYMFKSIFGQIDTPGQPAMAEAAMAEVPLNSLGVKLMYLSALAVFGWWLSAFYGKQNVKRDDSHYMNLSEESIL